jgi:hypothetical protein
MHLSLVSRLRYIFKMIVTVCALCYFCLEKKEKKACENLDPGPLHLHPNLASVCE